VKFLVDANVLSEPTKPRPEAGVLSWLRAHEENMVIDPIILGEMLFGILQLPVGNRRRRLERWFAEGVGRLACLPWDAAAGHRWARLLADLRRSGKSMSIKDSMIATTALVNGLTVVTRNRRHFENAGVKILDPFPA
jgi:predicted nucleic acid-binding protein